MLSAAPRASLTLPSCSPNYPRASRIGWTHARHCPFLKFDNSDELVFTLKDVKYNQDKSNFTYEGPEIVVSCEGLVKKVKFRRCVEDAEKLHFYSKTIKLSDHFISCLFSWLMENYLKSGATKINFWSFWKAWPISMFSTTPIVPGTGKKTFRH